MTVTRPRSALTFVALSAAALLFISCAKTDDSSETAIDDPSNVVQSAVSAAGSEATASESSGSIGLMSESTDASNAASIDGTAVDPNVHPFAVCSYASSRSACTAGSDTVTFNSCTADAGYITLNGTLNESFSSGACTVPVSNSYVTRTTGTSGVVLTISKGVATGATLTTDTNGGTTYSGATIPSSGTRVTDAGGTRTIVINGTHKVLRGPKGKTWFDHFITSSGLTVTGTRAAPPRTVTGNVTVYHQLAKYTATSTFNSVAWGSSTCCYPTAGNVTTTFSNVAGTATLAFTTTCGSANYTDTTGATSTITLNQCN